MPHLMRMIDGLVSSEALLRLSIFAIVLVAMVLAEALWPRRTRSMPRVGRWFANAAIVVIDAAVVRLLLPVAAVGAAMFAAERGIGLFALLAVPEWFAVIATLILLDLAIWAQHVVFHRVPLLWRFHRVHHTDVDLDASTALRFHPIEILISMIIKIGLVLALGAPPAAVVLFELILNGMAVFNHANVALSPTLDRILRLVIITPDVHRVHHSMRVDETNSNFGFNLSVWDRLFHTYRAQPRDGHNAMTIGLEEFRAPADSRLDRLLLQPFQRSSAG